MKMIEASPALVMLAWVLKKVNSECDCGALEGDLEAQCKKKILIYLLFV